MAKPRKKGSGFVSGSQQSGDPQSGRDTMTAIMDRERVAMRAYELYLARGGSDGQAMEDWLMAERELLGSEPRPRSTEDES